MKTVYQATACPNTACPAYGVIAEDPAECSVIKFGFSKAGRQRFKCTICGRTFTETIGTIFYRRHSADADILGALAQIVEGSRVSSVARSTGHKVETVSAWLKAAGEHAEAVEQWLLDDYQLEQGQLDGLWAFVGHKGEKKRG